MYVLKLNIAQEPLNALLLFSTFRSDNQMLRNKAILRSYLRPKCIKFTFTKKFISRLFYNKCSSLWTVAYEACRYTTVLKILPETSTHGDVIKLMAIELGVSCKCPSRLFNNSILMISVLLLEIWELVNSKYYWHNEVGYILKCGIVLQLISLNRQEVSIRNGFNGDMEVLISYSATLQAHNGSLHLNICKMAMAYVT